MVSIDKVKRGVARYLDEEFTNKMSGWQKWVFGASAGMYLENFSHTVERIGKNELVKGLGIIDEANNIDVDKLRKYFAAEAGKGPITFTAPMIGAVTLNAADIEKLYTCIMQA